MSGKPQLAGEPLSVAFKETPDDPKLLQLIGVADDFTGQHDEAQARYRRGLELLPRDPGLSVNLALVAGGDRQLRGGDRGSRAARDGAERGTPRERQTLALIYGLQGDRGQAERMAQARPRPAIGAAQHRLLRHVAPTVAGSAGAGDQSLSTGPIPARPPEARRTRVIGSNAQSACCSKASSVRGIHRCPSAPLPERYDREQRAGQPR